jgi:hypothetical protein
LFPGAGSLLAGLEAGHWHTRYVGRKCGGTDFWYADSPANCGGRPAPIRVNVTDLRFPGGLIAADRLVPGPPLFRR